MSKHICFGSEARSSDGCVPFANSDSNDARTLSAQVIIIDGGQYNNSAENCVNACGAAGFDYAGVEFATQCCMCFTWSL
jgi:hypothetical protein